MLNVNESAPIRLANAQSQLRRRTAAPIVPKPIAFRRRKLNAIASTIPARSAEQVRRNKIARNWYLNYGSLKHGIP